MNVLLKLAVAGAVIVIAACGSSREGDSGKKEADAMTLRDAEKEFDPSQYNPPVEEFLRPEPSATTGEPNPPMDIGAPAPAELIYGFRVQMFASTNIDDVSAQKEIAEEMFPGEWFYLVYDPPTYKLRAGNFLSRFEADRFLKQVTERGYRDSWIVPDRVYKDIAPRPEEPPGNPEDDAGPR
jgi:hypothetical protein